MRFAQQSRREKYFSRNDDSNVAPRSDEGGGRERCGREIIVSTTYRNLFCREDRWNETMVRAPRSDRETRFGDKTSWNQTEWRIYGWQIIQLCDFENVRRRSIDHTCIAYLWHHLANKTQKINLQINLLWHIHWNYDYRD